MAIKLIRQDLANHALIGTAAACAGANVAPLLGLDRRLGALCGAAAAGLLIELVQFVRNQLAQRKGLPRPHTVDPLDLLWTALGGVPVALAVPA